MGFGRKFNPLNKVLEVGKLADNVRVPKVDLLGTSTKSIESSSSNSDKKHYYSETQNNYGLKGKPLKVAYCGIQSLMAIATDRGEIHIYGQKQIDWKFDIDRDDFSKYLHFVKGLYLVVVTKSNRVITISLKTKSFFHVKTIPLDITCMTCDPTLMWLLFGLEDGTVMVYNVETNIISNYVINDLQKLQFFHGKRHSKVVSLEWNPKDLGTVLVAYKYVTVLYSLTEGKIKSSFSYQLEPYAPGGDFSTNITKKRTPPVIQALFHPNSLFVLTIHEDNSLVFWDSNTGTLIEARTLFSSEINIPNRNYCGPSQIDLPHILKAKWICQSNTEYTTLFIVNRPSNTDFESQSIVVIEFGRTPLYTLNSYESVGRYFTEVKQQKLLPIPNSSNIKDIIPIATETPFFSECHNPKLILLLLENGELEGVTFPIANFVYQGCSFPRGISWLWPKLCIVEGLTIEKQMWTQMNAIIQKNDSLLSGGALMKKIITQIYENEPTLMITGHSNGIVRIWNSIHKDYDVNETFEIDIASILNSSAKNSVLKISFATEDLTFAASLANGSTLLCKFEANEYFATNSSNRNQQIEAKFKRFSLSNFDSFVVDVKDRAPAHIKYGFMPQYTINYKGTVTALYQSAIEFTIVAYQDGTLFILYSNADKSLETVHHDNISNLKGTKSHCVTAVNLSIQQFASDRYSSILLSCGTDMGELIYFKIVTTGGCSYRAQFTNVVESVCTGSVRNIHSFDVVSLKSCISTPESLLKMNKGEVTKGHLVVIGKKELHSLKPGNPNISRINRTISTAIISSELCCHNNQITHHCENFITLVTQMGSVVCFTIPDFSNKVNISLPFQIEKIDHCSVLPTGHVIVKDGSYHCTLVDIFNDKKDIKAEGEVEQDEIELYDSECEFSKRPQVNSLQWIRGTGYIYEKDINDIFLSAPHDKLNKQREVQNIQQTKPNIAKPWLKNAQQSNNIVKDQLVETIQHRQTNTANTSNYQLVSNQKEIAVPRSRKNFFGKMVKKMNRKLDDAQDKVDDWTMSIGTSMNDVMQDNSRDLF